MTGFVTQIIDPFHVQKQTQGLTSAEVESFNAKQNFLGLHLKELMM